jgi:hypothetical protein
MRLAVICLVASAALPLAIPAQPPADVPIIAVAKEESSMKFSVQASVALEGKFDQWDATLTFPSHVSFRQNCADRPHDL